ncbi:hypothetical protein CALCODRAFT_494803 [Calocera cornea HHB12733]|uniref:N-acetyltransferase domain-containing protein n=1 Tax=Calocera cornea HHB12733 TaxID=1353952 RepID=A0A165GV95_9BASI|nr:hypothetical protein CALCODRAFT_494803 [Calocera cornea HHB12733]
MQLNAQTAVIGQGVIFIPYRREHVKLYRSWLSRIEGGSVDVINIEEEYNVPDAWENSEDTCVFVVLAIPRNRPDGDFTDEEIKGLPSIGVVQLFLGSGDRGRMAEVMIFIGETEYIKAGYDYDALGLLLSYASSSESGLHLSPYNFYVRIPVINDHFKALFRKFGFDQEKAVPDHPEYVELSAGRVSWDADFDLRDWPS